jgi:hypothetical protein
MFINFKSCTDQFSCSYLEYLNCITTKSQNKYIYIHIYICIGGHKAITKQISSRFKL